ncbi:MAG: sigma-70 family RNA polymerase sigma factor [Planctomycetes bacterium]|nr:sigma-70 family RNA polymerase sigma factor [Planctomycetota bacterium]
MNWRPENDADDTPPGLAARLRDGDEQALGAIFERFGSSIHRWLRWQLGSSLQASDREDIVSQTILRAWNHRDQIRPDRSPGPWILAIARNIAFDLLRHRREVAGTDRLARTQSPAPDSSASAVPASREDNDPKQRLRELLRGLPDVERRILEAWANCAPNQPWTEDLTGVLGLSPGALRVRRIRIIDRLRREMSGPDTQGKA